MLDYPNKLDIIFDKLDNFDIKPIIIGGYIRDHFLKIPSKDIDIEVYGVSSLQILENILREFGEVNSVGKSFGVCKLTFDETVIDFSLPRSDSKVKLGHKGFKVITDANLDFKIATSRRDFTINAIGYDVKQKKFLDPFNGLEDLKKSLLRAVDITKFDEDPLRVLRAVQFSSRFGFKFEKKLFKKCQDMVQSDMLKELPKERIFQEIRKLLLQSPQPSKGFYLLKKLNIFYLNEESYIYIDQLANLKMKDKEIKLTLFLTLITLNFSLQQIQSFLKKFTYKQTLIKNVSNFVKYKDILSLDSFNDYDIMYAATKIRIKDYLFLLQSIHTNRDSKIQKVQKRAEKLGVLNKPLVPLIQGKDLISLGEKPSKKFSKILETLYDAQLRAIFTNKKSAIDYTKNLLIS